MPESAQSSRKLRAPRPLGRVGRLAAPLFMGALIGLTGTLEGCGTPSRGPLPPVSTGTNPAWPLAGEAAPGSSAAAGGVHRVEPGETLWGIGRRYGVSVRALMRANGIGPREVTALQVGRVLRIPSASQPAAKAAPSPVPRAGRALASRPRRASSSVPSTELLAAAHLGQARDRYDAADFEGALQDAQVAGHLLKELEDSPAHRRQRARAFLVEGMAEVGLGERAAAQEHFRQAHRLDPGLSLDPATASPKLISVFDQAVGNP